MSTPTPPRRLLDAAAYVVAADPDSGRLVLDLERGVDSFAIAALVAGRKVRLVLMEVDKS